MMVLAAFLMPALSVCYFGYLGQAEVEPAQFYKWSAFWIYDMDHSSGDPWDFCNDDRV